jgi:hypothetical protein
MTGVDALGWVAAAVLVLSYLAKKPFTLVVVQIAAALIWIAYGVALSSAPVIVANVFAGAAATFAAWRFARTPAPPAA